MMQARTRYLHPRRRRIQSEVRQGSREWRTAIRGMPGSEFEPRRPLQKEKSQPDGWDFSFWKPIKISSGRSARKGHAASVRRRSRQRLRSESALRHGPGRLLLACGQFTSRFCLWQNACDAGLPARPRSGLTYSELPRPLRESKK